MKAKKRNFIHLVVFLVGIISCNKKANEFQVNFAIHSVILSEKDTIGLNDSFKAKVFLNSSDLYSQAKKEGIENYLKASFWNGNPNSSIAEPEMIGDTAIIEFKVNYLDSLSKDSTRQVYWEHAFYIDFDKSHPGHDTTFVTRSVIFIKN